MPNYLNGINHLPFSGLSNYHFRDVKMKTLSWSANSIEPGQTARSAGWPGSLLVAKANHVRCWQDKG